MGRAANGPRGRVQPFWRGRGAQRPSIASSSRVHLAQARDPLELTRVVREVARSSRDLFVDFPERMVVRGHEHAVRTPLAEGVVALEAGHARCANAPLLAVRGSRYAPQRAGPFIQRLRLYKSPAELGLMRRACDITAQAFV